MSETRKCAGSSQPGNQPPDAEVGIPEVPASGAVQPTRRKPYRKPEFVCERAFETTALACGKIFDTQQACHMNHRLS